METKAKNTRWHALTFKVFEAWAAFWMLLFRLFPLDRNKVVVSDLSDKGNTGNASTIVRCLLELRPDLKVVWAVSPAFLDTVPAPIRAVKRNSVRYFYAMATAKVWLHTSRQLLAILKRPGQYYIQAWHGTAYPIKRMEAEAEDKLSRSYVAVAKIDGRKSDLMISGSDLFTGLCRTIFWFSGEVLECGSPPLDTVLNMTEDRCRQVRRQLNVPEDVRLVLYAPTFRKERNTDCYNLDFSAVLDRLEADTGCRWAFLVRLHPHMAAQADFIRYSDRIVNATEYPNITELIPLSDMVVTDYSGIVYDAGVAGKPTFLYAADLDSFLADRGFRGDIRRLPFPLATDTASLLENIRRFDRPAYDRALQAFFDELGVHETGHASQTVARRILDVLDGRFGK